MEDVDAVNEVLDAFFDVSTVAVKTTWLIVYGISLIGMMIALLAYLLMLRSLALCPRKNNPTLLSVVFLFFTFLVDLAMKIEDLLTLITITHHSNANCRLLMYTLLGNKILQAMLVLFILYYNCLAGYFKTYKCEVIAVKAYPLVVVGLLLLELLLVIYPAMQISVHESGNYCEIASDGNQVIDWFYHVLLPYWFPLLLSLPPIIYMVLRYREGEYIEPRKTQVRLSVAISCSYLLLFFLDYVHLLNKQLGSIGSNSSKDKHEENYWQITRPIFTMIGHGWHIAIPLLCLYLDHELYKYIPRGRVFARREMKLEDQPPTPTPTDQQLPRPDGRGVENHAYESSPATDVVCIG